MTIIDDNVIASGGEDCCVKLWDWERGECVKTLIAHGNAVWGITKDKMGSVATASWDRTVIIWSLSDGRKEIPVKK